MTPAERLAGLVDPESLNNALEILEHIIRVGRGGKLEWCIDPTGKVQVVNMAIAYRRKRPESGRS